jgi:hypothetical protein
MFDLRTINNATLSGTTVVVLSFVWGVYRIVTTRREQKRRAQKRVANQGPADDRLERLERARQVRMARSRARGALLIMLSVLLWVVGLAAAGVLPDAWGSIVGVLQGTMFAVAVIAFGLLMTRGRRMRAKEADLSLAEGTPPIVYLRPFATDRAGLLRAFEASLLPKTTDQKIARTLRRVAPFIGIGDPLDELPPLGLIPIYTGDEAWQHTVEELAKRAGTIIIAVYVRPGDSAGLAWEVEHVVGLGEPERIILLLSPLDASSPSTRHQYKIFRGKFAHLFPRGLPDDIGTNNLMCFEADWFPRLFGPSQAPEGDAAATGPGEQRALVLRLLHARFNHHPFLTVVTRIIQKFPGRSNKVVTGFMVLLMLLGAFALLAFALFAVIVGLLVPRLVKDPLGPLVLPSPPQLSQGQLTPPPRIPVGYVQFQDRADHLSMSVPASWWQIDPASPDADLPIQEFMAANPALGSLLGSGDPGLKFVAGSEGTKATVLVTATTPAQSHPDDDLPPPELLKIAYDKVGGTVVSARNVTIAGHKALQLQVDLPSSALGRSDRAHITQDIFVTNGLLYTVTFGGDASGRTTIESTLSFS